MGTLYHCFYREPEGDSILASCFRNVSGEAKHYMFAATHLTKALAFAFSYHHDEVLMNSGIGDSEDEIVVLCGGQETLDKERHIRVFSFSDDEFTIIEKARQAVSENPMPFANTEKIMETKDINDLMRAGLQIFLLPGKPDDYMTHKDNSMAGDIWRDAKTMAEARERLQKELGARWINQERNINCNALLSGGPMEESKNLKPAMGSLDFSRP